MSQDLEGKVRKKCRVHALSNKQAKQRLDRGPRFLRHVNVWKWKNAITINEALVYLTDVNGIRKIYYAEARPRGWQTRLCYYEFRGERSPESWTKFWKEPHPKGVMFVAGVCSSGKTAIRFVKPGAKINMTVLGVCAEFIAARQTGVPFSAMRTLRYIWMALLFLGYATICFGPFIVL
ncbi:hypothetical protein BV898_13774 [Hypsibius exemplaris]|uniref:Uncharacterized protein n=1 Tax=Hypsibius exemplaris TaxID=2072580 RepID=A0A1W0W9X7_HYPEX|nr:hypothetical protein BV898_13774 [Hypsibius exemplaris]